MNTRQLHPDLHVLKEFVLGGQQSASERAGVAEHLKECEWCRQIAETLRRDNAPASARPKARPAGSRVPLAEAADANARSTLDPNRTADYTPASGRTPSRDASIPSIPGYEIVRVLGKGGMGVVYLAKQKNLRDRLVAIKLIRAEEADAEDIERFQAEAETAAALKHENIVCVYDFGRVDDRLFLVQEYVEGGTLAARLAESTCTAREAATIVMTLARAMSYAHENRVVHRDLKPGNVLIAADGTLKIADFGLAKRLEVDRGRTQTGKIMGTPSYMPPEQATGQSNRVGPAADIYSLGAILYELLTGRPPFAGESPIRTLHLLLNTEPARPRQLRPRLPRDLETICLKCLRKEPDKRYRSAAELAQDLQRFLANQPIKARPVTLVEKSWRWCRRNPRLAAASCIALLALLTASIVFSIYSNQKDENTKQQAQNEDNLRKADEQTRKEAFQKNRRDLILVLERGRKLVEAHQPAQGVHWLARGLESACAMDDTAMERVFRRNIAAASCQIHCLQSIFSHKGPIRCVAFRPDGKALLTAGADRIVRLWDLATGTPIHELAHESEIRLAQFSADGKLVAVADGWQIDLWSMDTGKRLHTFEHQGAVHAITFAPDGKLLASGSEDGTARIWDIAGGKQLGANLDHDGPVFSVDFHPETKLLLTGGSDTVARLWNVGDGIQEKTSFAHQGFIGQVAFSSDGKSVLTVGDLTARLWNATSGVERAAVPHSSRAGPTAQLSPDGRLLLIVGHDHAGQIYDVNSGQHRKSLTFHRNPVVASAFSRSSHFAATADVGGSVRLWNAATGEPIGNPLEHPREVRSIAISPNGRLLLAGCDDGTARLWTIVPTNSPTLLPHLYPVTSLACRHDNLGILTGVTRTVGEERFPFDSGNAYLWDRSSSKMQRKHLSMEEMNQAVAMSPNGDRILAGMHLCDGVRWEPLRKLNHELSILSGVFSHDGNRLLTGSEDRTARLWDARTGESIKTMRHPAFVHAVALSRNDAVALTGCADGKARLWDLNTGSITASFSHPAAVLAAVFSSDEATMATACADGIVRLWNIAGGDVARTITHPGAVLSLAFSPDGTLILTGCRDNGVRLWDLETGQPCDFAYYHLQRVSSVAFTPDGRLCLSGAFDASVRLRDSPIAIAGAPEALVRTLRQKTALNLDASGVVRPLAPHEWRELAKSSGSDPFAGWDGLAHRQWNVSVDEFNRFESAAGNTVVQKTPVDQGKVAGDPADRKRPTREKPDPEKDAARNQMVGWVQKNGRQGKDSKLVSDVRNLVDDAVRFENNIRLDLSAELVWKNRPFLLYRFQRGFHPIPLTPEQGVEMGVIPKAMSKRSLGRANLSSPNFGPLMPDNPPAVLSSLTLQNGRPLTIDERIVGTIACRDFKDDGSSIVLHLTLMFSKHSVTKFVYRPDWRVENDMLHFESEPLEMFSRGNFTGPMVVFAVLARHGKADDALDRKETAISNALAGLIRVVEKGQSAPEQLVVIGKLNESAVTETFAFTAGSFRQVHLAELAAGTSYAIDLQGDFDTVLRIEDSEGRQLAFNDDYCLPTDLNSRIIFTPTKTGSYRLVATSAGRGAIGVYNLTVREFEAAGKPIVISDSGPRTPKDGKPMNRHPVTLSAGVSYTFEIAAPGFDAELGLFDPTAKVNLIKKNREEERNIAIKRIDFTPGKDGTYEITVGMRGGKTGPYTVTVNGYRAQRKLGK